MGIDSLRVAQHGPVLWLTLNRPMRRNALTVELGNGLTAALKAADGDPNVRAVVLSGEGGHFCSGLDLVAAIEDGGADPSPAGRAALVDRTLVKSLQPALQALWDCRKPTVAALSGATVGFGLSFALACDLRLMADDAYLSTQFTARGLLPDGALLYQLERHCGLGRALELSLRPEKRLTAIEAQAYGLVGHPVAASALNDDALKLAQELARGAPLPQAGLKKSARGEGFAQALAAEIEEVTRCLSSADALEGLMAFMEKRTPVFTGA